MSDNEATEHAAVGDEATVPAPAPAKATTRATEVTGGILPPQHWAQASQDSALDDDDQDSALGDDGASSTASITSSILQYRTIHGRTYHSEIGDAQYWATNDQKHQEAMDMHHHLLTICLNGKLYLAPLKKDIQKALDIGTGTGIWAIDFADEFPNTEITGTDISPIQPTWVPPNLKFEIEDCTREWTFPPDSFDYVHIRWLVGSIVDWTALFKEAYKCCKPGGYVESFEPSPVMESDDGSVLETSAMGQWAKFFIEGGRKFGRTFTVVRDDVQRKAMEEAGFVNIEEHDIMTPIGSWPRDPKMKERGQWVQLVLEHDLEGHVLFLANVARGWTKEEIHVYIAQLRREVRSGKHHGYYRQKVVWGQRPDSS